MVTFEVRVSAIIYGDINCLNIFFKKQWNYNQLLQGQSHTCLLIIGIQVDTLMCAKWKTDSLHILEWKPILWSNCAACAYIVHMSRDHNENTPFQMYWKFHHQKTESLKKIWYCHISAQNIDWGGSNEYPQSMLLRRNKKIMYTPVNPIKCYYIRWSLRGSKLYTL